MGSGNSSLYGTTLGSHSIKRNLTVEFKQEYGYKDGLFGTPGNNKRDDDNVRHITSPSPVLTSRDFYTKLTKGGKVEKLPPDRTGKVKGFRTEMADGTYVTYRRYSTSDGSPAVDINISYSSDSGDLKSQKIHFVRGGTKNGSQD